MEVSGHLHAPAALLTGKGTTSTNRCNYIYIIIYIYIYIAICPRTFSSFVDGHY